MISDCKQLLSHCYEGHSRSLGTLPFKKIIVKKKCCTNSELISGIVYLNSEENKYWKF